MSKHTPAPWLHTNDIAEEGFADIESKYGSLYIRAKWGAMGRLQKGKKKELQQEMAANARLIAASPNMLAALHVIASQSLGEDWTAEQALAFIKNMCKETIRLAEVPA